MPKKKELTKEQRIKKERKRLEKIYENIPEKEMSTFEKLVDNISFMAVTLEDLMLLINNDELIKLTVNSSQSFLKENPALTSYNKMYANFLKGLQQLSSLLPREEQPSKSRDEPDEFEKFMASKKWKK